MILNEIDAAKFDTNNPSSEIEVVGLVDDSPSKIHTRLNGVKVLGNTKDIPEITESLEVDQIIFAIPSCTEADKKRILEIC
jgi:FlaA1/EpsC-like NDP-sugar epimerase